MSFEYRLTETGWGGWCAAATRGAGVWRSCLSQRTASEALRLVGVTSAAGAEQASVASGNPIIDDAAAWLISYFLREDSGDPPPLDLRDETDFGSAVLLECSRIPWGRVMSYGELASRAGSKGGARAVGQAMGRNPLAPFVPCHRVIGAGGALGGFGWGPELKIRLLEWEGWEIEGGAGGGWRLVGPRRGEEAPVGEVV